MQIAGRRLVLRARTVSQCRYSQSSRQVARSRTNVQWQRQFSSTQQLLDDDKSSKKPRTPKPKSASKVKSAPKATPALEESKVEVLRDEDDFKVVSKDAAPGEGQEIFAKDVDEALESLEGFQAELGVSDEELDRLMTKFPGIDLKLVEQLKQGNLKEPQVRQILKERYPDGPPESIVDKDMIGSVSELEDYIKLVEKMNTEALSPKERTRLQTLHAQIMQDPEVRQAMLDGVVSQDDVEVVQPEQSLQTSAEDATKALNRAEVHATTVDADKSEDVQAKTDTSASIAQQQNLTTAATPLSEQDVSELFEMPELDEETLAELSPEERELFEQMRHEPELVKMLQTESMIDFAEQLKSGQFSADFLMGLSQEEREGLVHMQNDPEFVKTISALPTQLQEKMNAKPELVERARKLGEKIGLRSQGDVLLSLPEYDDLLGDVEAQAAREEETGKEEEDEDEDDDDEFDGLSIEELEEKLAEAREDPDFRKFEAEMEEELERKFAKEHPQYKNIQKRMLTAHLVKYAKAKRWSNLSGRERSLAGIYGGAAQNPVRKAFAEGRASALDKEIDLYMEKPQMLHEYMGQLEQMREDYDDQYDNDDAFARRMDKFDRETTTDAERQMENALENINEADDMEIMDEPDDDFLRNPEPGFWNYEEDPAEEWGEDESFDQDDITALAHGELELHREIRQYARYMTWEMPLLHKLAKPHQQVDQKKTPLRFRYTTYMGESHPAAKKVMVEFLPADLGLTPEQTLTLQKLLGARSNPTKSGHVRMSCESFETQAQNKRYLGDLIAKLIKEAVSGTDKFVDVPLDNRHVRQKPKYSFPKEWRMTEERRAQIDGGRGQIAAREKQRLVEGRVVDGVTVIQRALRAKMMERVKEPVLVPAGGARKRLA